MADHKFHNPGTKARDKRAKTHSNKPMTPTQREQAGKDRVAGWRKKRLKGTKRFTDISDRELNIGPVTPIGRGSQPLDPGAHDVARGIAYTTAAIPLSVAGSTLRAVSAAGPRLYKAVSKTRKRKK